MVLGKSCKLVPVMLMNVLLYRRKFARHKYLVVALVTIGITSFMFLGGQKKGHKNSGPPSKSAASGWAQLVGMLYLLANLLLDGVVNSTQDQIFQTFKPTGQQMMLHINLFSTLISTILSVLPLPHIPVIHPTDPGQLELVYAIQFLKTHPDASKALAQFAITGALGQLFIFETLQHFGSLTLVYVHNPPFSRSPAQTQFNFQHHHFNEEALHDAPLRLHVQSYAHSWPVGRRSNRLCRDFGRGLGQA